MRWPTDYWQSLSMSLTMTRSRLGLTVSVTTIQRSSVGPRPYTRRQIKMINQDHMIFGDFSANSYPRSFKFCKGHFLFKS